MRVNLVPTADPTNGNKIQTKEGEKLQVQYMGTHPRIQVQFSEVTKKGAVEISDYAIPIPPGQRLTFDPIGGAVNLTLLDSQVNPEGTMTVTLSYANVVLGEQFVDSLTIMEDIGDGNWLNLVDVCADTSGAELRSALIIL